MGALVTICHELKTCFKRSLEEAVGGWVKSCLENLLVGKLVSDLMKIGWSFNCRQTPRCGQRPVNEIALCFLELVS